MVIARMRVGLTVLVTTYLAVLVVALVAAIVGSVQSGLPALLREMSHLLFAPIPILLLPALIIRSRGALLGLAVPILAFTICYGPQFTPKSTNMGSEFGLRILSFNVGAERGLGQPEATLRTIDVSSPDVICLVEAPENTLVTVGARLRATYPHQASGTNIFILSRFPLTDVRPMVVSHGAKNSLQATLEVDHRLMTLTVVHLQRVDSYSGLRGGPKSLARAVQTFSTDARDAAVHELIGMLRAEGGTQILVGDLNLTPTSQAYRLLRSELQDAFLEAGWGLGHTYPTTLRSFDSGLPLPLVRIDYIFHSPDLTTGRAWVGPSGNSDHLPITADLNFR